MYKRNNDERNGSKYKGNHEKSTSGGREFNKPNSRPWEDRGEKPARKISVRKANDDRPSDDGERKPFKRFDKEKSFESRPYRSNDRPFRKSNDREQGEQRENRPFRKTEAGSYERPYRRDENGEFKRERPSFRTEGERRPRRPRNNESKYNEGGHGSTQKQGDGRVRLNKLIAASGICSRREADDMISAGLISVNGTIISELGTKVFPSDDIRYNGERLRQERLVYIVMNKPKDFVTTTKDPFAKKTVMELLEGACKERVFPVGRLDRNTTGVLLITNDGELAKKLTHPSHNKKKIYHVHLDKSLKHTDLETIVKGMELEDGFIKADEISFIDPEDKKQIGIEIHSGRNRIVRRIFEELGYKVTKLDRVYFAGLTKKGLQRGQWRFLSSQEIGMLKMGSYQ